MKEDNDLPWGERNEKIVSTARILIRSLADSELIETLETDGLGDEPSMIASAYNIAIGQFDLTDAPLDLPQGPILILGLNIVQPSDVNDVPPATPND